MTVLTRTKQFERFDLPGFVMPDSRIFSGDGGDNERYGPLNGYHLLEAAETSLCETIDAKGVEACSTVLRADLLKLNMLEQIAEGTARIACFVGNLEEEVVKRQEDTNAKLQELIEVIKTLAESKA